MSGARKAKYKLRKPKYTASRAFKDLGRIDKAHESGRITKAQHDSRSKKVLKRLVKKK